MMSQTQGSETRLVEEYTIIYKEKKKIKGGLHFYC